MLEVVRLNKKKQLSPLTTDVSATSQKPSSKQKTYSLLQLKRGKKFCCHVNFRGKCKIKN